MFLLRHEGYTSIPCDIMYRLHHQKQLTRKIQAESRIAKTLLIYERPPSAS